MPLRMSKLVVNFGSSLIKSPHELDVMGRAHLTAKQVSREVDKGGVDMVVHVGDIAVGFSISPSR